MSNMRSQHFWFSLACTALLASCGGGSSDGADVGPATGVQQYPGGVWEGTVGTGAAQRQVVGYIDPGPQGTGGEFYLAREAPGAAGFDALYGRLNVSVTSVLATGVTYFSVQDGKFATGLTLRGTASNSGKIGRTDAISGNYSDPVQTAAASGATVPLKLAYSSLNFHTASPSLIEGTYRGTGLFGGGWVLTVTPQGQLSGRIGGCLATGSATPRAADSPLYSLTINLSGRQLADEQLCDLLIRRIAQHGIAPSTVIVEVTEGALVGKSEATQLAVIEQLDPVYVTFTQSGAELLRLKQAVQAGKLRAANEAKVQLLMEDGSNYANPGKLNFADLATDPDTGAVTLRAEFPNPRRDLLPGMFVRVRFPQGTLDNAIKVPQKAVQLSQTGHFVMVVGPENKAVAQPVKVGAMAGTDWVINEGLKGGEQVIVNGLQKVKPGAPVTPQPLAGAAAVGSPAPAAKQGS